jgi:hypothetical protein
MKTGIIVVVSFLVGAGTGYLIADRVLKQKYADIAQEEIDSVRAVLGYREVAKEYVPKEEEETVESFRTVPSTMVRSSLDRNKSELMKKDYQLFKPGGPVKVIEGSTETEPQDQEQEEMVAVPEVPYIIDDVQYSEECDHFAKIDLVYYQDGVLMLADSEEMVDDVAHTIGNEAFSQLTTGMRGPLWVRNEQISADYEIMVMAAHYGEMMDTPDGSMRRRTPHESEDDET